MDTDKKAFTSSIEWLAHEVEVFLANNPEMEPSSFGYRAINDPSLVARLRAGGDVTTRKMDKIIAFLQNPNQE